MIEKELATPEYYPLTLNALTLACNQKSNRFPVLHVSDADVKDAMLKLQQRKLCHTVYLNRSRSGRYQHHFDEKYGFSPEEKAIVCELFIRGPQTMGELNTHTARMVPIHSIEKIETCLNNLMGHMDGPYVKLLERQPGQKEPRYAHLFCGEEGLEELAADTHSSSPVTDKIEAILRRVEHLEGQVAELTVTVKELKKEDF